MPNRRSDPEGVLHFQTERVFQSDDEWFICTREGIGVGPYISKALAISRGDELVARLSKLEGEQEVLATIRHFVFETSGLCEEKLASR